MVGLGFGGFRLLYLSCVGLVWEEAGSPAMGCVGLGAGRAAVRRGRFVEQFTLWHQLSFCVGFAH